MNQHQIYSRSSFVFLVKNLSLNFKLFLDFLLLCSSHLQLINTELNNEELLIYTIERVLHHKAVEDLLKPLGRRL